MENGRGGERENAKQSKAKYKLEEPKQTEIRKGQINKLKSRPR